MTKAQTHKVETTQYKAYIQRTNPSGLGLKLENMNFKYGLEKININWKSTKIGEYRQKLSQALKCHSRVLECYGCMSIPSKISFIFFQIFMPNFPYIQNMPFKYH